MRLTRIVPIIRIFDEHKAKQFYLEYLGFQLDWEHRFEPTLPLYMQISRNDILLHLTEHHGDCCPGAAMRIQLDDIDQLHAELHGKAYPSLNPGIEEMPWGTRDLSVIDPFGNRITFCDG